MSGDSIGRLVSQYRGHVVTDRTLLQMVGITTYCQLWSLDPSLWSMIEECKHTSEIPGDVAVSHLDADSVTIKQGLIRAHLGEPVDHYITEMIGSSYMPPLSHLADPPLTQTVWLILLTILIVVTVYVLITLGIVDMLLTGQDSLLVRLVN